EILTANHHGRAFIWNLPVEEKPAEDLRKLARLLSGDTVTPSGSVDSSGSQPLATIWKELRNKYPADFTTSTGEIAAWHQFEAQDSELQKQWFAAAFHLQHLSSIRPGDQSVLERLARAREQL